MSRGVLIERESERAWLEAVLAEALEGRGSLVLLAGEAGVGKTRFAEEVVGVRRTPASCAAPPSPAALAYGPVISALRGFMRAAPGGLSALRSAAPASGAAAARSSARRSRRAIAPRSSRRSAAGWPTVVAERPAVVLLDDLQWSDDATLELLAALAAPLRELPHARARRLSLGRDPARASAQAAAQRPAPQPLAQRADARAADRAAAPRSWPSGCSAPRPSARLAGTLHDRTGGIPFFIEELAGALEAGGRLQAPGRRRRAGARRRRAAAADDPRRRAAAGRRPVRPRPARPPRRPSVAGTRFDVELVAALGWRGRPRRAAHQWPDRRGRARAAPPSATRSRATRSTRTCRGCAGARCTASWPRRSRRATAGQAEVAAHWLAARDGSRALDSLVRAVEELAAVHAYRDAARLGPPGARPVARGRARRGADRRARAPRALRGARRASWPRRPARSARWWRRGARRAPGRALADAERRAGRDLRAPGRPRARARRPARRGRRLRRERPPRRGRRGAADRRRLPAERRQARRGRRAHPPRRRGGRRAPSAPICARGSSGSRASRA